MTTTIRVLFVMALAAAFMMLVSACSSDTKTGPVEVTYQEPKQAADEEVATLCQASVEVWMERQGREYDWNTLSDGVPMQSKGAVRRTMPEVYNKYPGEQGWSLYLGSLSADNQHGGKSAFAAACVGNVTSKEVGYFVVEEMR